MLTNLDGLRARRHGNSHHRVSHNGQVHHGELSLGGNQPTGELGTPLPDRTDGSRHLPAEAGVPEAGAESLAYRFLRRPEVQECLEFFGLAGDPGELGGSEPAPGQSTDLSGVAVLEVYADWARQARGDRDEVPAVAEAHPERVDVRTAEGVVAQDRRAGEGVAGEQGARELEDKSVGCRSVVALDGVQPDVHGGQIGARTLIHRKKVSR
jgi:hypothetical protein